MYWDYEKLNNCNGISVIIIVNPTFNIIKLVFYFQDYINILDAKGWKFDSLWWIRKGKQTIGQEIIVRLFDGCDQ